jgi:hypothetical protein
VHRLGLIELRWQDLIGCLLKYPSLNTKNLLMIAEVALSWSTMWHVLGEVTCCGCAMWHGLGEVALSWPATWHSYGVHPSGTCARVGPTC